MIQRIHAGTITCAIARLIRRLREPCHRHRRPLRQQRHHQTRTHRIPITIHLPTSLLQSGHETTHALAPRPDTTFCSNVVRPAVSVEPAAQQQCQAQQQDFDFNFQQHLVGHPLPLPHDAPAPDFFQSHPHGHLEPFAFTDGAFDASFNAPLDFSFDDLINADPATVAVDPGAGAA